MDIKERVKKLRNLMEERGIDAYIIPSSDPHQSEYVADRWRGRAWISGFTGSAGTVVITKDDGGLWTDGRYFIQAEDQLKGSGIRLFKMREPKVPTITEYLVDTLKSGETVGFDGKLFSVTRVNNMKKEFDKNGIDINSDYDLVDEIWQDRPEIPKDKVFIHDVKYAGKSRAEKLKEVRNEMKKKKAKNYLISSLDDIAWLFNLRGNDVNNSPVFISYALVTETRAYIFMDTNKVSEDIKEELLKDDIKVKEYSELKNSLKKITDSILFDPLRTNYYMYKQIPFNRDKIKDSEVTTKLKAVKNDTEIENLRNCHLKDGVAIVKFIHWLKNNVKDGNITEISADEKLTEFRSKQKDFISPSFDTIAAYKEHAAMMHYKATKEGQYTLKDEAMFLIDSGGQYLDGTTDITRTIVLGDITDEMKRDFTLTLKGHINLTIAKFLYGATGSNLDILARKPLWEYGIDYKCGTGHGVGFLLNVHEGPQNFSQVPNKVKLEKGMILTNEPGVYKKDKHGIRLENTLLVVEDEKTEFGQFMKFDTISYCPLDLDGVDVNLLTEEERDWLNSYHKEVYDKLSPFLTEEEKAWLKEETRAI
ncbi:aminopeptidase P family protein [Dethiothermospora halolimnae]|uniref:aminopeptidase P family protein n=1 Tax=Dethiothermospora halolimnae TaxID=3114390 RepID=UPI003CCC22F3